MTDDPDSLPLEALRPTQLYLSAEKLGSVLEWFEFDRPHESYGRLPAFEHEGEWYLSDGHTRAFVAYLAGVDRLRVERDRSVREEYDFGVYRECIGWCRDEGVTSVPDLAGRVLAPESYETEWLERCDRAAERLETERD